MNTEFLFLPLSRMKDYETRSPQWFLGFLPQNFGNTSTAKIILPQVLLMFFSPQPKAQDNLKFLYELGILDRTLGIKNTATYFLSKERER